MLNHPFTPSTYDKKSSILILGSFPSVASRTMQFYYQHPQNRFWKILANLFRATIPYNHKRTNITQEEIISAQKQFLQSHNIVLWDIVKSCSIEGSSDSKLTNATYNDIFPLLIATNIHLICLNGALAAKLFCDFCATQYNIKLTQNKKQYYKVLESSLIHSKHTQCKQYNLNNTELHNSAYKRLAQCQIFALPSTSPANATYNFNKLLTSWQVILQSHS